MNRLQFILWTLTICLVFSVFGPSASARAQTETSDTASTGRSRQNSASSDGSGETQEAQKKAHASKKRFDHASDSASKGAASDSEILAAKSSGKVWVNLNSGVYHKGRRWYGKTKNGKFMTETEAKAAGYKKSQKD
jgi:hypothetical protein